MPPLNAYSLLDRPCRLVIYGVDLLLLSLFPFTALIVFSTSNTSQGVPLDSLCGKIRTAMVIGYGIEILLLVMNYLCRCLLFQCVVSSFLFVFWTTTITTMTVAPNCLTALISKYCLVLAALLCTRLLLHIVFCYHLGAEWLRDRFELQRRRQAQESIRVAVQTQLQMSNIEVRPANPLRLINGNGNYLVVLCPASPLQEHAESEDGYYLSSYSTFDASERNVEIKFLSGLGPTDLSRLIIQKYAASERRRQAEPDANQQTPAEICSSSDNNCGDGKADCCPICMDEFHDGDDVCFIQCLHVFHAQCIKIWLSRQNSCPTCRTLALQI